MRFFLATGELTPDQTRAFIAFLGESGTGWWHYLPNTWLIDTDSDDLSASSIRDKLVDEIAPNVHCVIVEIIGKTYWAGFGPSGPKRDMFKWFTDHWNDE